MTQTIVIRPARPDENECLADFFYQMWMDNGMTADDFSSDWKSITCAFMKEAEDLNQGRALVADAGDNLVGGGQCLVSRKLYPPALKPSVRKDGYIWGVYVKPEFRRQGLATRLARACMAHLESIGCTRHILHASPSGRPVYASLGFQSTNEMRLEI